jgi:hypothetical protein
MLVMVSEDNFDPTSNLLGGLGLIFEGYGNCFYQIFLLPM